MNEGMREEIVLRASRLRAQFPDAPLDYFARSLSYELDLKPETILRVLEATPEVSRRC